MEHVMNMKLGERSHRKSMEMAGKGDTRDVSDVEVLLAEHQMLSQGIASARQVTQAGSKVRNTSPRPLLRVWHAMHCALTPVQQHVNVEDLQQSASLLTSFVTKSATFKLTARMTS